MLTELLNDLRSFLALLIMPRSDRDTVTRALQQMEANQ